jgi:hypothetical protein
VLFYFISKLILNISLKSEENCIMSFIRNLYSSPNTITVNKSGRTCRTYGKETIMKT